MSSYPLEVCLGDHNMLNVMADVLVITIHPSKQLKRGILSNIIYQSVGEDVQQELNESNAGEELNFGQIVETGPGKLQDKFRHLLFVCLDISHGENSEELQNAFQRCLQLASILRAESIVFPSLGTGALGYSDYQCCKALVTGLVSFRFEYPLSPLAMVFVSLYRKHQYCLEGWDSQCRNMIKEVNELTTNPGLEQFHIRYGGLKDGSNIGISASRPAGNTHDESLGEAKRGRPASFLSRDTIQKPPGPGLGTRDKDDRGFSLQPWAGPPDTTTLSDTRPRNSSGAFSLSTFLPSMSVNVGMVQASATPAAQVRLLEDGVELNLNLRLQATSPWLRAIFGRIPFLFNKS